MIVVRKRNPLTRIKLFKKIKKKSFFPFLSSHSQLDTLIDTTPVLNGGAVS